MGGPIRKKVRLIRGVRNAGFCSQSHMLRTCGWIASVIAELSRLMGSANCILFDRIKVPLVKHRRGQVSRLLNLTSDSVWLMSD